MQKEEYKERIDNFKKAMLNCFNNEDGKVVLEFLKEKYNLQTNFTNPNYNYYRDGAIEVLNYIEKFINKYGK